MSLLLLLDPATEPPTPGGAVIVSQLEVSVSNPIAAIALPSLTAAALPSAVQADVYDPPITVEIDDV